MKFCSQKGYTGIDIAISIVVITMFISLIAVVISRFNSSANEIKYKFIKKIYYISLIFS